MEQLSTHHTAGAQSELESVNAMARKARALLAANEDCVVVVHQVWFEGKRPTATKTTLLSAHGQLPMLDLRCERAGPGRVTVTQQTAILGGSKQSIGIEHALANISDEWDVWSLRPADLIPVLVDDMLPLTGSDVSVRSMPTTQF